MQLTYIGYSKELIRCLLEDSRIKVVSIITKSDVLSEEDKKVLAKKKIHIYEMGNDVYKIDEHILTEKVLIYKFGYIIPKTIISKYEFYNIHPGSLDNNRGAHPMRWTILLGEEKTWMTLYRITGLDEGYVIFEEEVKVEESDYLELDRKMDNKLKIVLEHFIQFSDQGNPRNAILKEHGNYRPKMEEKDYTIDILKDDYKLIQRKIRAVKDYRGAVLFLNDIKYRVLDIALKDEINMGKRNAENTYIEVEQRGKIYVLICEHITWRENSGRNN